MDATEFRGAVHRLLNHYSFQEEDEDKPADDAYLVLKWLTLANIRESEHHESKQLLDIIQEEFWEHEEYVKDLEI